MSLYDHDWLDRVAKTFGVVSRGGETDEELREMCMARIESLRQMPGTLAHVDGAVTHAMLDVIPMGADIDHVKRELAIRWLGQGAPSGLAWISWAFRTMRAIWRAGR
jgi:hypothetical protein